MRVFVTGGTGFIGSRVIESLMRQPGLEVVACRTRGSGPRSKLTKEPSWVDGNLEHDFSEALKGTGVFIHLAAHGVDPRRNSWDECFRWNLVASLKLWMRAASLGVRRFIIAGSCFEYGSSGENYESIPVDAPLAPVSSYGASKAAASLAACALAREHKLELAVLRPFHVYGEGEPAHRFFPMLKAAANSGADFPMTPGGQVRDFMEVNDVARVFLNFVFHPLVLGVPQIFNLGTGKPQSLLDFAQSWWTKWQARGRLVPGALPYRPDEIMRYVPALSRIENYIPS